MATTLIVSTKMFVCPLVFKSCLCMDEREREREREREHHAA